MLERVLAIITFVAALIAALTHMIAPVTTLQLTHPGAFLSYVGVLRKDTTLDLGRAYSVGGVIKITVAAGSDLETYFNAKVNRRVRVTFDRAE